MSVGCVYHCTTGAPVARAGGALRDAGLLDVGRAPVDRRRTAGDGRVPGGEQRADRGRRQGRSRQAVEAEPDDAAGRHRSTIRILRISFFHF